MDADELDALIARIAPVLNRFEGMAAAWGKPLPERVRAFAGTMGVREPDRVRVLAIADFEEFAPEAGGLLRALHFTPGAIDAICLRYALLVRAECAGDDALLVHELAHTAQYERMGLRGFLSAYVAACVRGEYATCDFEREAEAAAARFRAG